MSSFAKFLAAGRRLGQAIYRLTHLGKLVEAVDAKIPPSLRNVQTRHLLMALMALMMAVVGVSVLFTQRSSRTSSSQEPAEAREETGLTPPESEESASLGETGSSPGDRRGGGRDRRGGGPRTAAADRRAITDSTIKIGFIALEGFNEFRNAVLGPGDCYDCGDNGAQIQAVVSYINDQGGVANREVVPVIQWFDTRRAEEPFDVWAQQACATFTEDNKVWAVIDLWGSGIWERQLLACLARHDIPRIGYTQHDQKFMDDHAPYAYSPSWMNMTRAGRAHISGLVKQGFFERGAGPLGEARIGLIRFDTPSDQRAADQGFKRTLAAHDLKLTEEVAVSYYSRLADLGAVAAQAGNAVLRFRQNGITHVLVQDRAQLANLFMSHAEPQGYRPRYGLNSFSALRQLQGTASDEQLRLARVVGWDTISDVLPQDAPPPNTNKKICVDILRKTGPQPDEKGLSYCDGMLFLKMAGDEASDLTTAGFQTAVERLGTRFEPPISHAAGFGSGRYDGASKWGPLAFHVDCGCFRYVGTIEPIR